MAQADSSVIGADSVKFVALIVGDCLYHAAADENGVELRHLRRAIQEDNALDQPFGVMHLVDRLMLDGFVKFSVASVVAHLRVHHVLVNGRQFIRQKLV